MLFNSLPFAVFFVLLYLGLLLTPRRLEAGMLLGASLLFYSMWHPIYLLLLLLEVSVNYAFLRLILARGGSRMLLSGSIVFTLGLLAWFKYSAMAVETLLPILEGAFGSGVEAPDYFLPLGISFYSFQIIAMNIDANRGQVKEVPTFARYLLFISFFPQLIAGPIVRFRELMPQLSAGSRRSRELTRQGIGLVCLGAFKKVVMGDFLLAGFVNGVFADPGAGAAGHHLIAMYAFAFQIYFDFSGYTDIARGLGCLLGYQLPANFREPYLALNPADFWRRWHITLSTWFRDYVFMPLSFSKRVRSYVSIDIVIYGSLAITWSLVGLWHGANWHFVLWGVYQGLLLALHRLFRRLLARIQPKGKVANRSWLLLRWMATFHLVVVGLLLFRSSSTFEAWSYFAYLFTGDYSLGLPVTETALVVISLGFHWVEGWFRRNQEQIQESLQRTAWGTFAQGAALGTIAALTLATMGSGAEFIYFQF